VFAAPLRQIMDDKEYDMTDADNGVMPENRPSCKCRIVSEQEFRDRISELMLAMPLWIEDLPGWVTGPGRSGAIAAVYASHLFHIPFVPFGQFAAESLGRVLIIDTARESGRTLRKAERKYESRNPLVVACFEEPPRVAFWYEAPKPQRYRHERRMSP